MRKIFTVLFASLLLAPGVLAQEVVFQPIDLAKNPYQFKGHSGILDSRSTPILMPGGRPISRAPLPGMTFDKMLDEHTALYEVMAYEDGVMMPQGELAVIVSDSTPPDPARRWRVRVVGQIEGWNGYGAKINVTGVRFEGYYVPPPPTPEELRQQAAAREALRARQTAAEKAEAEAQAKHQVQVEQEIARREAAKLAEYKGEQQEYCDTLARGAAESKALQARIAAKNPGWAKSQAESEAKMKAWRAQFLANPNKTAEEAAMAAVETQMDGPLVCPDSLREPVLSDADRYFIRLEVEQQMGKH